MIVEVAFQIPDGTKAYLEDDLLRLGLPFAMAAEPSREWLEDLLDTDPPKELP